MSTILKAFAILVTLIIGYQFLPDSIKKRIESLSAAEEKVVQQVNPIWVIVTADGTGSGSTRYSIPRVDTEFLREVAELIKTAGAGGRIYLNYIDRDSRNNPLEVLNIPSIEKYPEKPVIGSGANILDQQNLEEGWLNGIPAFKADSLEQEERFQSALTGFLKKCDRLLEKIYSGKTPDNAWSDVNGNLNSSIRLLSQPSHALVDKYIFLFSDCQHELPAGTAGQQLELIPGDIRVFSLNPVPGSSPMVSEDIEVLEHQSRVFEILQSK